MLIIGSRALNIYDKSRKVNDLDIICYKKDISVLKSIFNVNNEIYLKDKEIIILKTNDFNIECLLADNVLSLKCYLKNEIVSDGNILKIASPATLFSIKKAHIHFPIKFEKHIKDYHILKNMLVEDNLKKITELHFKCTEERLGKLKTPNMNQNTDNFFKQSENYVDYIYVHDDVHMIVKHKELPMYKYIQKDDLKAECNLEMFNRLSNTEKIWTVLEEAYVIALERKIIPFYFLNKNSKYYSAEDAFKWALMRICTTLCDGWFREFATNNYFEILNNYNENYVEKMINAIQNKEIKQNEKYIKTN